MSEFYALKESLLAKIPKTWFWKRRYEFLQTLAQFIDLSELKPNSSILDSSSQAFCDLCIEQNQTTSLSVQVAGQIKITSDQLRIVNEELMLIWGEMPNQCIYDLRNRFISILRKLGVRYLIPVLHDPKVVSSKNEIKILWFCYSRRQSLNYQELLQAKRFANIFFAQQKEKLQISGLTKKVIGSRLSNVHKSRLISGLSHDLRSPINNLQAILECFGSCSQEQESLIKMGQANIRLISELVEDFISLARYRSGSLLIQKTIVDFEAIFSELRAVYDYEAQFKNLHFQVLLPEIPIVCSADCMFLKRIISNLLSNAIKYTHQGEITLSAKSVNADVVISVVDTGPGLTPDQMQRICRPFVRFSDQKISGVGLGMAITKLLIQQHQGKLEIFSEIGNGTEFRVTLPI